MINGRNRVTLDALRVILMKVCWSGTSGIGGDQILCEADHEDVLAVLELLTEAKMASRGAQDGRYYLVKNANK